jgi:type II secretory pathway component PulF
MNGVSEDQAAAADPSRRRLADRDPALLHLWDLVQQGVPLPGAMEAAAQELGSGASGAAFNALADRLRRGGVASGEASAGTEAPLGAEERFLANLSGGPEGTVGAIGNYLALRESIRDLRSQIARSVGLGLVLLLAAIAVGLFVLWVPRAGLQQVLDEFELETTFGIWIGELVCWVLLVGSLMGCLLIAAAFAGRRASGRIGRVAESVLHRVPLLGSTLIWIDLAEMSDAMARLLERKRPYPEACATVAALTPSATLRRWLRATGDAIARGASLDDRLARLPWRASLLTAWLASSGPAPDQPDVAWRIAAEAAWRRARRRTMRTVWMLPPLVAIFAGVLAWGALTTTLSRLGALMRMLSWLG